MSILEPSTESRIGPGDLELAIQSEQKVLVESVSRRARERCACLIHENGSRRQGQLVTFRCDADQPRQDLSGQQELLLSAVFEQAQAGTLFLDEIGALSPQLQGELLALLDAAASARIVAGTSRSLLAELEAGTFSTTLYYRLNVIYLSLGDGPGFAP